MALFSSETLLLHGGVSSRCLGYLILVHQIDVLLYLFTIKGFELVPDTYDGDLGKRKHA